MTILMPVEIFCETHEERMTGEYDELRHRFIMLCQKCYDEMDTSDYDDGYNDGYKEAKKEGAL